MIRPPSNNHGSITLETTVIFPVFLAFMLALINFINIAMVYVAMDHAVGEATKQIAAHLYPAKQLSATEPTVTSETWLKKRVIEFYPLGKLQNDDFKLVFAKMYDPAQSSGIVGSFNQIPLNNKDIILVVEYKVPLMAPFFSSKAMILSNTAMERAWVDD